MPSASGTASDAKPAQLGPGSPSASVLLSSSFLGDTLDTDHIEADYTAGVLTLAIPVSEAAKPRTVEITSQDARRISPA